MSCTERHVPKLMRYARTPICGANLTKFIQVHLNGSGSQHHSPYQSEALENVYYWYDGNVPYCPDATAWQPLDDNFLHTNVPVYSYVDNYLGTTHQVNATTCRRMSRADFVPGATQVVNIRRSHTGYQERPYLYTPQHWEPSFPNAHNYRAHMYSTPASPCSSLTSHSTSSYSSLPWSDSVQSSPIQPRRPQQHWDDVITSESELQSALRLDLSYSPSVPSPVHAQEPELQSALRVDLPYSPSAPQIPSSVHTQEQPTPEAQAPTTPPPSVPTSPAPDSTTPEELVGRRAPKRRRVTRAVQPLACFFCRGRKIACGPPTNSRSGDRTCEYVVTRLQLIFFINFVLSSFFCATPKQNTVRRSCAVHRVQFIHPFLSYLLAFYFLFCCSHGTVLAPATVVAFSFSFYFLFCPCAP